jgi:hypothetical protein
MTSFLLEERIVHQRSSSENLRRGERDRSGPSQGEEMNDTCKVEVVGSATESEVDLRLCSELRTHAVFVATWI